MSSRLVFVIIGRADTKETKAHKATAIEVDSILKCVMPVDTRWDCFLKLLEAGIKTRLIKIQDRDSARTELKKKYASFRF